MIDLKKYMEVRVREVSQYIIETSCTVRETAKVFGVTKSTIHDDMTERLLQVCPENVEKIKDILAKNKALRHIRGGESTKRKYKQVRND
jgi:putative DeoR family transcriptional regulator (stage III sporulation protein D)